MSDDRRKDVIAYAAIGAAVVAHGLIKISGATRRIAEAFELVAEKWAEAAEDEHVPPPMPTGPTGGIDLPGVSDVEPPPGPDYTPPPRPMPPPEGEAPLNP